MIRRLLTMLGMAVVVMASVFAVAVGRAAPARAVDSSPIILIGTGGITWSDVSPKATPNLWSFLRDGSSAALTVRSVNTNTCPVDGWLALSAGERAAATVDNSNSKPPCQPIATPEGTIVPGWLGFKTAAAAKKFDARLGLLAEQATRADTCVQAVGPGAAIGAALPTGIISRYDTFKVASLTSDLTSCPIVLVDVGSLRDPKDVDPAEPHPEQSRAEQVRAIDARIGQVLAAASGGWDIVVASLSDAGESERLRLVAAKGPDFGPGTLVSPSTRQTGLAQSSDLTVTLLAQAGLPVPDSLGGAALHRDPAPDNSEAHARERLRDLVDYDQASHEVHSLVPPFFNGFAYSQVVIYAFVLVVWRRRFGSDAARLRLLGIVRAVAVIAATVPVSTFLANLFPWWRFSVPMVAVVASVGLFVAAISCLALLTPIGRMLMGPLAVVSTVTIAVLALDVMTGSRLQLSSLMGLQPVVGGRFYGMGNVTFALFGTCTLLLCIALSHRPVLAGRPRLAATIVGAVGAAALLVDGAPFWGADGGGPPALIPGLVYLLLAILGVRMNWWRWAVLAGGTAILFLLVGFLDWLRPVQSRSHLGRFFQTLIDGGAWDVVARKFAQNMAILFGNYPLTLLVPIALAFVIYVLARPTSWGSRSLQHSFDRAPTLRPGLIALLITLAIGFAINDSGTAIPAVGATVAVPLIVTVSVRTLEEESRTRPGTRAAARAAAPSRSNPPLRGEPPFQGEPPFRGASRSRGESPFRGEPSRGNPPSGRSAAGAPPIPDEPTPPAPTPPAPTSRAEQRRAQPPTRPGQPTEPPAAGTRGSGSRHAATSRRRGPGRRPRP